ncbi:uncharacterized protein LOC144431288 isoform X3 [Styela clava]
MNEAQGGLKDEIKNCIDRVESTGLPLTNSDVHAMGSFVFQCGNLGALSLRDSNLDTLTLKILTSSIEGSDVKIRKFCLASNNRIDVDGYKTIGNFMDNHEITVLDLDGCDINAGKLRTLNNFMTKKSLKDFTLDRNIYLDIDGINAVGEMVQDCEIERLFIAQCQLTLGQLQLLSSVLGKNKLSQLSISQENKIASHEDILAIANLIPHITEDMWMEGWEIQKEDINLLRSTLKNSGSKKMKIFTEYGVLKAKTDEAVLSEISYSSPLLRDKLNNFVENEDTKSLILSNIQLIGDDARGIASAVSRKPHIHEISFKSCNLGDASNASFFNDLANNIQFKALKIHCINVEDNPRMGNINMDSLGSIVNMSNANVINFSKCKLSMSEFALLRRSFNQSKYYKLLI